MPLPIAPDIGHIQELANFPVMSVTAALAYNTVYLARKLEDQLHYPLLRVNHMPCIALVETKVVYLLTSYDIEDLLAADHPSPRLEIYGYTMDPTGNLASVTDPKAMGLLHRLVLQNAG